MNERREDIIPLAKYFLVEFNKKFGKNFNGLSPEAENALMGYDWVGNVRELRNLIERGVLTGRGSDLTVQDLGIEERAGTGKPEPEGHATPFPPIPPTGIHFPSVQESFEKFYIEEALRMARGNESKAARLLNINHHTFRYRKRKLRIK